MRAFIITFISIALGILSNIVASFLQPQADTRRRVAWCVFLALALATLLLAVWPADTSTPTVQPPTITSLPDPTRLPTPTPTLPAPTVTTAPTPTATPAQNASRAPSPTAGYKFLVSNGLLIQEDAISVNSGGRHTIYYPKEYASRPYLVITAPDEVNVTIEYQWNTSFEISIEGPAKGSKRHVIHWKATGPPK